jgi:hypothetical protein
MESLSLSVTVLAKGNRTACCEQEHAIFLSRDSSNYLFTPWSTVLLEKLTGCHLVKKFSFHGTRWLITAFTNASHLSLSWASSIQSIPSHHTSWRSIIILSSHLARVFQVVSFLQVSPTNPCVRLSSHPHVLHATAISFFSIYQTEQYWVCTDH